MLDVGDRVAHYRLEELLGQGGMGAVFRARDVRDGRLVAVKVMGELGDPQRFELEAKTMARLSHPGIPRIFDVGLAPDPYLVQEIIEGDSLESRLDQYLPQPVALQHMRGLLEVLAVVHRAGYVHRDLTPNNILLRGSQVCLIDFGLVFVLENGSRLTTSGQILGTPEYMAPEQIDLRFGEATPRTDLFAAGTILYRMLCGHLPTRPGTYPKVMRQIVQDPPIHPEGLEEGLRTVLLKALQKRPEQRYASAEEFASALPTDIT